MRLYLGGFGAALYLSSFAVDGVDCRISQDVESAISRMHKASKPIAALCIAPALLAKLIPGVNLTIGGDEGTAPALESMGASHQMTSHGEVVVDRSHKVVTTPCYLLDARVAHIAEGASKAIEALLEMCD